MSFVRGMVYCGTTQESPMCGWVESFMVTAKSLMGLKTCWNHPARDTFPPATPAPKPGERQQPGVMVSPDQHGSCSSKQTEGVNPPWICLH